MNKTALKGIYDVSHNHKKQISLKVNLPYGKRYLTDLKLIYENKTEKFDENPNYNFDIENYQAVSEKLFCYACNIKFNDYIEMRKHQWTFSHRQKRGLLTTNDNDAPSDDNDDSEDNNVFDERLLEEELEVENENEEEDEQESDENLCFIEADRKKEDIPMDNFNDIDCIIAALKYGKISFNDVCAFPTIYFGNANNEIIGIKRCLLFNRKNKPENPQHLMECVNKLSTCKRFAVFLYSGGCFSGAIFEGDKSILHKSFKRYTYRRQQGGSQTTKDNQGGTCKSGGAYLRRVNTKKLLDEVFQLLHQTWAPEIDKCDLILVWSAKSQRYVFGHEAMFNQSRHKLSFNISSDPRVRFISARVSKVNSSTLLEVYRQMSTIEIYGQCMNSLAVVTCGLDSGSITSYINKEAQNQRVDVECKPSIMVQPKMNRKKLNKKKTSQSEHLTKEFESLNSNFNENSNENDSDNSDDVVEISPPTKEEDEIRTKVLNYILNDSSEDLQRYFNELKLSKSEAEIAKLLSLPLKTRNQSFLHLAVSHRTINVIHPLLAAGCDPLHRNIENETPYAQAIRQKDKTVCNTLSDYMFKNPDQYDYFAAKFPGGKDPLKEEQKRKQLSEKKKQYKKDRKQRLKLEEEERKREAIEKCQRDQFLSLDDKSKICHLKQVERDLRKRFLLCFQCALDISGVVPFSYSDFSFCGMECLKKHRVLNEK